MGNSCNSNNDNHNSHNDVGRIMRVRLWSSKAIIFAVVLSLDRLCANISTDSSTQSSSYGWEDLDYYELLGLSSKGVHDPKDVRKAYRKQAQQWHPDKVRRQNGGGQQANVSVEESNARFARIAEAYQVLSDEEQRREYDAYLQNNSRRKNRLEDLSNWDVDPWKIFDNFFGGSEEDDDAVRWFDDEASNFHASSSWFSGPDSVREERQRLVDHVTGRPFMRLLQTEEYFADGYYRVLAQDFVEAWDPLAGSWVYQPLQIQPMVFEQGYRNGIGGDGGMAGSSILRSGDVMTPGGTLRNGRYVCGISPSTCELWVTDKDRDMEIWVSETTTMMVPPPNMECHLGLEGPHLVLTTSTTLYGKVPVWTSAGEEGDKDFFYAGPHIARLDSDGSLAVYRVESLRPWLQKVLELRDDDDDVPSRRRGLARRLLSAMIPMRFDVGRVPVRLVCLYATGPAGCFRFGRMIIKIFRDGLHLTKSVLSKFDRWLAV